MQIKCPRCEILLGLPPSVAECEAVPIQCGACGHQFTLQLNRPSLKIRKADGKVVDPAFEGVTILSDADDDETDAIVLTQSDCVEGFVVVATLGQISSFSPMSAMGEERDAAFLSVVARAQNDLRGQARGLGANGVILVTLDSVGSDDSPALRITGTAVKLTEIT